MNKFLCLKSAFLEKSGSLQKKFSQERMRGFELHSRLRIVVASLVPRFLKAWEFLNADRRACVRSVLDERSNQRRLGRSEMLRKAASSVMHSSGLQSFEDSMPELGRPVGEALIIRPLRAIELGLLFDWIRRDDERVMQASDGQPQWSASLAAFQARWEEACGLVDVEHESHSPAVDTPASPIYADCAVADVCAMAGHGAGRALQSLLLADARPQSSAAAATCTLFGAFVAGRFSPVAFSVTKQSHETCTIEAMGTRHGWRRRGIGGEIALHLISRAKAAGQRECSVDSVPAARAFWCSQGFKRPSYFPRYELSRMTLKF